MLKYEPNPKHKHGRDPDGSECPNNITLEDAQKMLETAISHPTNPRQRWCVRGAWVFCARETRAEANIWHGYPVVGHEVCKEVLAAFVAQGWLTRDTRRLILEQQDLPHQYPAEIGEA